jgi:glycine/D-amino acid oxidase-like deaminating enzyme
MSKILIIGGGVSGLSAGIYARLCGDEAIICEKHMIAGGNLTGWIAANTISTTASTG